MKTPRFIGLGIATIAVVLVVGTARVFYQRSGQSDPRVGDNKPISRKAPPSVAYVPVAIGSPASDFGKPWVTHVEVVDLDQDGLQDILYCEAQKNSVRWIRQYPRGTFQETVIAQNVPGPAHVSAADLNGTGRLDILVACMGQIPPTNDRIGSVLVLENVGNERFERHVIIDGVSRVSDVRAANLVGHPDGRLDLVVAHFGYNQGETAWMENKGAWTFERHVVNTQSGCVHTPIADFDGDGKMDFAALISQEWEEIHLFLNPGQPGARDKIAWGSTNEDFGSSGLMVADLNRDGRPDLVFTSGDALDYSGPTRRAWHGVQWLENQGGGEFTFHRIGQLSGAYGPAVADLNSDGFPDVIAVAAFADWSKPETTSMMAWLNDGSGTFTPVELARAPTHLITLAVGDIDGNGAPVIVTGGFHLFGPWDKMSNITLWRRK